MKRIFKMAAATAALATLGACGQHAPQDLNRDGIVTAAEFIVAEGYVAEATSVTSELNPNDMMAETWICADGVPQFVCKFLIPGS